MKDFMDTAPWPYFYAEDQSAVAEILSSGKVNYWTGDKVRLFESEFASYTRAPYAFAVANGTVSLDMVLKLLDLQPGDEVIVTPRTYFASVSSIVMAGGRPVFADICRDSQNITADTIARVLTPRTRAVLPVHLAGWPCDMPAIVNLLAPLDIKIIEDCAQAHGATLDGKAVGTFGLAGSYSFCQDKIMTTCGEGGMLTINDEAFAERIWAIRDHGKSLATVMRDDHAPGFRWLHESFGSNYRMTEIQAAVGINQLLKLNSWVERRREHAYSFNEAFSNVSGVRLTIPPENARHAYYKYYFFVETPALRQGWSRDRIMGEISELGVPCFSGSCPEVYREKAVVDAGFEPNERLPVARELGETSLMLLVHPTMNESHRQAAIAAVKAVMKRALR